MKNVKMVITAAGVCLVAGMFSVSAIAGEKAMTTAKLTALLSGNTAFIKNTSGKAGIQVYGADGSLESGDAKSRYRTGVNKGKWKPNEYGTWEVQDGMLCNKYTKPKKRSGGCDKFFKDDDGSYFYRVKRGSGKKGYVQKIVAGRNPD